MTTLTRTKTGLIKKDGCLFLDNDIKFQRILKNPLICNLVRIECYGDDWCVMREEKYSLGDKNGINVENIKRILSELSFVELTIQFVQLINFLDVNKVSHNNINPGNILFCDDYKRLILCDFNWACYKKEKDSIPSGLNLNYSSDDKKAFSMILKEIYEIDSESLTNVNKDMYDWFMKKVNN